MKIDTSNVRLTTTEYHSESIRAQKSEHIQFWEVLDKERQMITDQTVYEEAEIDSVSETQETLEFSNSDISNHPRACLRNVMKGSYLRNTAIDNLIIMGEELTDEQRMSLSDNAIEQLEWVAEHRITHQSFSKVAINQRPDDISEFQRSDSITDDIETMVQWLEEGNSTLVEWSNRPCLNFDPTRTMGSEMFRTFASKDFGWKEIDPNDYRPQREGVFEYELESSSWGEFQTQKKTQLLSQGSVTTQDGQEYRFDFGWNFEESTRLTFGISDYQKGVFDTRRGIDPLVISANGDNPTMVSSTIPFDLNADGVEEEIHMMAPGSGFLCLDKNGDGIINDGKELFGPSLGNGFLELIHYDKDENWWIDENDAVFEELRFWENDGQGNMRLKTLKEAGIGAIYLDKFDAKGDLKDDSGQVRATIKHLGVALREDGSFSAVQEMNWLV